MPLLGRRIPRGHRCSEEKVDDEIRGSHDTVGMAEEVRVFYDSPESVTETFPSVLNIKGPQRGDAAHPLGMPFQFILARDKSIVFCFFFFCHDIRRMSQMRGTDSQTAVAHDDASPDDF